MTTTIVTMPKKLDDAQDFMEEFPCKESATNLLVVASHYYSDLMISLREFGEIADQCQPYLKE